MSCLLEEFLRDTAQRAYHAYGEHVDWRTVTGGLMPNWEDQAPRLQEAWVAAMRGAYALPPAHPRGAGAPPSDRPDRWAIIELQGRRKVAGRIYPTRQWGVEGVMVEQPHPQGGYLPAQFWAGTALLGVLEVPEQVARRAARSWECRAAARRLGLLRPRGKQEELEEWVAQELDDLLLGDEKESRPQGQLEVIRGGARDG